MRRNPRITYSQVQFMHWGHSGYWNSLLRPLQACINLSEVGLIRVTGQGLAVAVAGSKWEYCVICQDCFSPLSSLRYVRQFQTTHVFFSFLPRSLNFCGTQVYWANLAPMQELGREPLSNWAGICSRKNILPIVLLCIRYHIHGLQFHIHLKYKI